MGSNHSKIRAVFNWSGGKDSALALYKILQEGRFEVIALLTTINRDTRRSTMHGIPLTLLQRQAESIGIPLHVVDLTPQGGMTDYESAMSKAVKHFQEKGVRHFIFGDIFLHDVRSYREKKLSPYGIEVVEPLWNKTSEEIMEEFLASGLRTIVITTTAEILDERFLGRHIDRDFIHDLPPEADVCGENGEYHTFCYAGGIFHSPIPYRLGDPIRATYPVKLDDGTVKEYTYCFANLQAID